MRRLLPRYLNSPWLPALVYLCTLCGFAITAVSGSGPLGALTNVLFWLTGLALFGLIAASIWNFVEKRWSVAAIALLLNIGCGAATVVILVFMMFASMYGPSEDGFAENLLTPEGIEIAEPDQDAGNLWSASTPIGSNEFQYAIREALTGPGDITPELTPAVPSLHGALMASPEVLRDYAEASPEWHVFVEQEARFVSRRWSYGNRPQDTLNGYISEFCGVSESQSRCLICSDRKQWRVYSVPHMQEGATPLKPDMSIENYPHRSRLMGERGGGLVDIFEQSGNPERRGTRATLTHLEAEFTEFLNDLKSGVSAARTKCCEWASQLSAYDAYPFRLRIGIQPGMYGVAYALNPGEPGFVYLKAFEVTKGTPLSVQRLAVESRTRTPWSTDSSKRFRAEAGFTIYEGDWGKPYAARFEVWFSPDSGMPERKLAERIFKIEGWQR